MAETFAGLLPVLLVIGVGALIRRIGLLDDAGWRGVDQVSYYVLFPAIITYTVATAKFGDIPTGALALVLSGSVLTMGVVLLALRPLLMGPLGISGPAYSSIFQGASRWNSFMALVLAATFFGQAGVAMIAVAILAMVPILNVMCVLVLSRYASGQLPGAVRMGRDLITNPFIWSSLLGAGLNGLSSATGLFLPEPILAAMQLMGRGALAVALLSIGAGLNFSSLRGTNPALLIACAMRLVLMPIIGWIWAISIGLEGPARGLAILTLALPTATGSYVLARKMGGDAPLMAEIVTVQTILSAMTLPVLLSLLG